MQPAGKLDSKDSDVLGGTASERGVWSPELCQGLLTKGEPLVSASMSLSRLEPVPCSPLLHICLIRISACSLRILNLSLDGSKRAILLSERSCTQAPRADVNKWFLPGASKRHDLKAFLEQQHPTMPSALLDPTAPAPWRNPSLPSARSSPKQAAGRSIHSTSASLEPSPGRHASSTTSNVQNLQTAFAATPVLTVLHAC